MKSAKWSRKVPLKKSTDSQKRNLDPVPPSNKATISGRSPIIRDDAAIRLKTVSKVQIEILAETR